MGAAGLESILSHFVVVVSRDSAEKKCNQTITGPTYGADYILEILGQKWRALPNFLALRNRQNLVLEKIIKSRLRLVRFSELLLGDENDNNQLATGAMDGTTATQRRRRWTARRRCERGNGDGAMRRVKGKWRRDARRKVEAT